MMRNLERPPAALCNLLRGTSVSWRPAPEETCLLRVLLARHAHLGILEYFAFDALRPGS
jgi:hypothetical protein